MKNTHPNRHPESVGSENDEELLTESQVVELFSISIRTLRNWRNKRKLSYYKIGRRIVYERSNLILFISSCKVAGRS